MPLVLISCIGWVTNHFTATVFVNQLDISAAVGYVPILCWQAMETSLDTDWFYQWLRRRLHRKYIWQDVPRQRLRRHGSFSLLVLFSCSYLNSLISRTARSPASSSSFPRACPTTGFYTSRLSRRKETPNPILPAFKLRCS